MNIGASLNRGKELKKAISTGGCRFAKYISKNVIQHGE